MRRRESHGVNSNVLPVQRAHAQPPHFLIGLIAYALQTGGGNPAKSVRKDARMKIDIFNQ